MKKFPLLLASICFLFISLQSQNIELTFTGVDKADHIQLDSIKVMNRTRDVDTTLHWPDTVLMLYYVGVPENPASNYGFRVMGAYPNPVKDYTTIRLFIPEKEKVNLLVTDLLGRTIMQYERILDKGEHAFRLTSGEGSLCFFTAKWRNQTSSIKILQTQGATTGFASLRYIGNEDEPGELKTTSATQSFYFVTGDELLYIGYFDTLQSGMLDTPEESKDCTFQFAFNIPCPGTPTVEYEGQTYNTVQIMSQCWLKENLNVGAMIDSLVDMSDNGIIEKYCYKNNADTCSKYGGLYQWHEIMKYDTIEGTQGICPPGWYIPTDKDWFLLVESVDSQLDIGELEDWHWGNQGFDAGKNLKSTWGWITNSSNSDLFGFSAPGAGVRTGFVNYGSFVQKNQLSYYWTSTTLRHADPGYSRELKNYVQYRLLVDWWDDIDRGEEEGLGLNQGFSVRCIKD